MRAMMEAIARRAASGNSGSTQSADDDGGTWARSVGGNSGGGRAPSNPGAVLGEWLDTAVVADEATIEKPVMSRARAKRKALIKEMRIKERFRKPTADGLILCALCEWGPLGKSDVDSRGTPYLTEFDRLYRENIGRMNWLHLYRTLRNFWNLHIATQAEELTQLDPEESPVPSINVCDLQHHYEKCCRTRNLERIMLEQVDTILHLQDNIMDNGMYVIAVDDTNVDHEARTDAQKKARPLVNPKYVTQWRELNRSFVYTMKAYLDLRNADGQVPASGAAPGKRKKGAEEQPGPTQKKAKTAFGRDY